MPKRRIIQEEMNARELLEELESNAEEILEDIKEQKNPGFDVPSRSAKNFVYNEKKDIIYMGSKKSKRTFHNTGTTTSFTQMLFVMSVLKEVAEKDKHLTKREVYYQDPELFNGDQNASDNIIEDIAVSMRVTRPCIRVVATAKGVCVGDLTLREGDDTFNCNSLGRGGWSISPFIDEVEIIDCGAEYILVVEKDAALIRLIEENFHKRNHCLLITGKGQPDIATRRLIRRLHKEEKLPVYVLTDSDSYGMQICSSYKRGSISLSFESPYLAVPKAHLLGLLPSDLDKFDVSKAARLKMTDWDIKKAENMLEYPWIKNNRKWRSELQLMVERKEKAELQALARHGITFMTDVYIPQKLDSKDWI
ncbi:MAG: DNA topoisomerase IV subunit A [Candidatus Hydrothermarchaeales archaeon]